MGWFKPQNTFAKPTGNAAVNAGQPAPGTGAQWTPTTSPPPQVFDDHRPRVPLHPTRGKRTWLTPSSPRGGQQGMASPLDDAQRRPSGGPFAMTAIPPVSGLPIPVTTPYYSRGAAATVQNFGKVLYNPIGAGIPVPNRTQPSYGPSGQYIEGSIWWTSQVIPTSIPTAALTSPQELADLLDPLTVYAVARVNG